MVRILLDALYKTSFELRSPALVSKRGWGTESQLMDDNRDGLWVPFEIELLPESTWLEKILVARIYAFRKKGCFASNKYLAEYLGVSERWVSAVINDLIKEGVVVNVGKEYRQLYLSTKMTILLERGWNSTSRGVELQFQGGGSTVLHSNTISNTEEINTSPSLETPLAELGEVRGVERSSGEKELDTEEPTPNIAAPSQDDVTFVETDEDGNPLTRRWGKTPRQRPQNRVGRTKISKMINPQYEYEKSLQGIFEATLSDIEKRIGRTFIFREKQYAALDKARKLGIGPKKITERAVLMSNEQFWKDVGFDLNNVLDNLNRR